MPEVKDAIKFIRENDIDHEPWTDAQIANLILTAIQRNGFGYVLNSEGNIRGLYIGHWEDSETFNIVCLVGRGAMKDLLRQFKLQHPQIKKFTGKRHIHEQGTVGKYSKNLEFRNYEITRL